MAVWRVIYNTRSPGAAWEVMVDAGTNRVISVESVARYLKPQREEKQ